MLCAKSLSQVQLFVTPWNAACQAPLGMEFSRQEFWSGLPLPPPGDLPNTGIKSAFVSHVPALANGLFTALPPGKPHTLTDTTKRHDPSQVVLAVLDLGS